MDSTLSSYKLDDATKLYLGGYLVCLLADFSERLRLIKLNALVSSLSGIITKFIDSKQVSERVQLLESANDVLEEISEGVLNLAPVNESEYLQPVYKHRDNLLGRDAKITEFLYMICDEDHDGRNMAKEFTHSVRHDLSELGASLFSLHSWLTNKPKGAGVRKIKGMEDSIKSTLTTIVRRFSMEYLPVSFMFQEAMSISRSYRGTEYHKKAAHILIDKISALLSSARAPKGADAMFAAYQLEHHKEFADTSPHITSLLELLSSIVPPKQVRDTLVKDPIVTQIIQRLEGAYP